MWAIAALSSKSHSVTRINPGCIVQLDLFSFLWITAGAFLNWFIGSGGYHYEVVRPTPEERRETDWEFYCVWVACVVVYVSGGCTVTG